MILAFREIVWCLAGRTDDFEWLLQRFERDRGRLKRNQTHRNDRIETVDELVERRRKRSSVLMTLLKLLPFLVAVLVILLR